MHTVRIAARAALLCALPVGGQALAHHSVTASFDTSREVEIRGTVVDFKLRSPHASLVVDGIGYIDGVAQSDGVERWEIESSAAPGLRERGYTQDSIKPGDRIVVRGAPSRRGLSRANSRTFLREDGSSFAEPPDTEFVFHPQLRASRGLSAVAPIEVDAVGIQKIEGRWQPPYQREGTTSALPLNEAGLEAWRSYDQTQSPANTCEPMSIPVVFNAPGYFVDLRFGDGNVVIRNQAYDIVRKVPLDGVPAPADPDGEFGTVSGKIEGETLIVESSDYPVSRWGLGAATQINGGGADVPSSAQKSVTERFSIGNNDSVLVYEYTLFDPVYMATPHTAQIELARVPDSVPMYPYDCNPDAARQFSRAAEESLIDSDSR